MSIPRDFTSTLKATRFLGAVMLILLAACVQPDARVGTEPASEWSPPPDSEPWKVEATESSLTLRVYRAGPLSAFGHNHIIEFPLRGTLYRGDTIPGSGFDLHILLKEARVDFAESRASAGEEFDSEVSDSARSGTRQNMFSEDLLDKRRHPHIDIHSVSLAGSFPDMTATVAIIIKGQQFEQTVAARVRDEEDGFHVVADLDLKQTDFGLEPYSILGGGLQVADGFTAHIELLASRPAY